MARGTAKQPASLSSRQISHTRLYDETTIDQRYERLNKLGEGSFGTVYRVKGKDNQLFYAMKTIAKKHGSRSKAMFLDNEVKLLTEVNHANLIQLHEVLESSQNLYLVIELCEGGELGGYVKKNGPLPEETIKQIMSKLINALYYLHKMDIVHRDLKLENILLRNSPRSKTDQFDIRVTDFGLSSKKSITSTDSLFNDFCGTPLYMAPEILENKNYSALCDVWAMGIIMYYLICGRHPFVANDERRLLELIRAQKLRFDAEKFRHFSPEGLDFLQGMLVYDTVHRRTMGELIAHPWLTGELDRSPTKDIITMMREFQAENDQRQQQEEERPTDETISALVSVATAPAPVEEPTAAKADTPPSLPKRPVPSRVPKSSETVKTTPRRSFNPISDSAVNIPLRLKQATTMADLSHSNPIRQSSYSSKFRSSKTRLGRSQSQSILPVSSRHPPPATTTTTNADDPFDLPLSSSFTTGAPISATTTALLMINKQYANTSPIVSQTTWK